jgi:hypothetical protein
MFPATLALALALALGVQNKPTLVSDFAAQLRDSGPAVALQQPCLAGVEWSAINQMDEATLGNASF